MSKVLKPGINQFSGEKIYIATADANSDGICDKTHKITYIDRPSRANMQPIDNSIWFAKMKDSKKNILFINSQDADINKIILSTGFYGIQCKEFFTTYLWCYIISENFETLKNNLCNGTTMQAINNDGLDKIAINVPTINELKKFDEITKPIFLNINNNKLENEKLAILRDSLLPKLMSGEINVSNIDI